MSQWLTTALQNAKTVVDWCWNFLTSNEYFQMLLIICLIPLGFYVFGKAKDSVAGGKSE